jgi:hypothetical protein
MLKLNAGFSRKVGEPNYGSRGASVNVELEVESSLIGDADGLMSRIRRLFEIARQSVDSELASGASDTDRGPASRDGHNGGQRGNQCPGARNTSDNRDQHNVRYATSSQVRAIQAICNRQNIDAMRLASERFRVEDLEELTLQEASTLIDQLKNQPAGRNGGGR